MAVAAEFANAIVQQDYQGAWRLLTKEAQATHTPAAMKAAVEAMISYASGPIRQAEVIEAAAVERWPGQRSADLAVVYVALTGDSFSEAVELTISRQSEQRLIRDLAWGRP